MGKHILFLLNPGFYDGEEGPYFCPHSAAMEGFLKYTPEIEKQIEVRRIDFQRPRKDVVELLGEDNQNTPVLVIDESLESPTEAQLSTQTKRAFIVGEIEISNFLSKAFGVMKPH